MNRSYLTSGRIEVRPKRGEWALGFLTGFAVSFLMLLTLVMGRLAFGS